MPSEQLLQIPPKKNHYVDFTGIDYLSPIEPTNSSISASPCVSITQEDSPVVAKTRSKTVALVDSIATAKIITIPKNSENSFVRITSTGSQRQAERVRVIVKEGASVTLTWDGAGSGFFAAHLDLILEQGSSLSFAEVQDFDLSSQVFTHINATLGKDAKLSWAVVTLGAALQSAERTIDLAGQGADAKLVEVFFGSGKQIFDHDVLLNHLVPNTQANLLSKGILMGTSRSVFFGLISIAEGAQKTNSFLSQHAMLLSSESKCDATPSLEIAANDVRASHAASVGQIDEEHLFYLMSRGIPLGEAKRLIVLGFLAPAMALIDSDELKEKLTEKIHAKWRDE